MEEKGDLNNEVKIADDKPLSIYAWSVLIRLQPRYYDRYKCVKIKVITALLSKADTLVKFLKNVGIEEEKREKKELVKDNGYVLKDAYEITLKKKMSIDYFESEEDKKTWEKFLKQHKKGKIE